MENLTYNPRCQVGGSSSGSSGGLGPASAPARPVIETCNAEKNLGRGWKMSISCVGDLLFEIAMCEYASEIPETLSTRATN